MTVTSPRPPKVTHPEQEQHPVTAPRDLAGALVEPAPYFHDWDETPHAIFPATPVSSIALGDVVLGGSHQVEGIGRADQRGRPALRLDLQYLIGPAGESTARIILPVDHAIEVKRYFPEARHRYAWTQLIEAVVDDMGAAKVWPARLIPDYGPRTEMCCGQDVNPDGYESSATMCDACASDWAVDYDVVRHGYDI